MYRRAGKSWVSRIAGSSAPVWDRGADPHVRRALPDCSTTMAEESDVAVTVASQARLTVVSLGDL
jgi:hypothetical protein